MKHNNSYIVLGLMSGTSMDGLDCCLSEIQLCKNYDIRYKILDSKIISYTKKTKKIIFDAINDSSNIDFLDNELGKTFSKCVESFLRGRKVDLIGTHGQTIAHKDKIEPMIDIHKMTYCYLTQIQLYLNL